ncbi:hypothetical protein EKK58_08295 [Candidatus Dependentiae bacterium]|nr:MAG: hypothetical protein EKK58_08295 [Candidatus Dependentiae bacterium]
MEGISLGRSEDSEGKLNPYDWKGNIALVKRWNGGYSIAELWEETTYVWNSDAAFLDEEILIGGKCLIMW